MREKQIAERDFHLCDSGMLKKRQEKIKSGKNKGFWHRSSEVKKFKRIKQVPCFNCEEQWVYKYFIKILWLY